MKRFFIAPEWYSQYGEFSEILSKRNNWFVHLRYYAAGLLLLVLSLIGFISNVHITASHRVVLFLFPLFILAYNTLFHRQLRALTRSTDYISQKLFALKQIAADLITLAGLVYFTGGIESPFSMLFVLHMIIAGLMLPSQLVVMLSAGVIIFYNLFSWAEFFRFIPHFTFGNLIPFELYSNIVFVVATSFAFSGVIISSAFIAYRIAAETTQLQEALFASYKELEAAEMEKQRYVMAVVHEIKQPVSAVISYLRIIAQKILGELSPPVEEKIVKAVGRCEEAIEMINNVLRISRLKLLNEITSEDVELKGLIEGITGKYASLLTEKNIHLDMQIPGEKLRVIGDAFLLNIALSNIIGNAVKYNRPGGRIQCRVVKADNNIEISVDDNGIGIPEGEREKIFNTFFRASNISGKNLEGSGIGLSAVQQIVARHNGTISIDSPSVIGTPDHPGTSVKISLPS